MIIEVLDGLAANGDEGNGKVEASVKKRAIELCKRYPIYPVTSRVMAEKEEGGRRCDAPIAAAPTRK